VGPVAGAGCAGVDVGVGAGLELVDGFCCLGDMLSVDGDGDAAVGTRVRVGWCEFKQLVLLLANKDISLMVGGELYGSCVRGGMLHGSGDLARGREGWGGALAGRDESGWMDVWRSAIGGRLREGLGLDDMVSMLWQDRL